MIKKGAEYSFSNKYVNKKLINESLKNKLKLQKKRIIFDLVFRLNVPESIKYYIINFL